MYGLMFLGAHFIWAFSLMFLFSGRGYWQELFESIVWAQTNSKLLQQFNQEHYQLLKVVQLVLLTSW